MSVRLSSLFAAVVALGVGFSDAAESSLPFAYYPTGSTIAAAVAPALGYAAPGGVVATADSPSFGYYASGSVVAADASAVSQYVPVGSVVSAAAAPATAYLPVGTVVSSASSEAFVFGPDEWSLLSSAVSGVGRCERRNEGGWLVSLTNEVKGTLVLPDCIGDVVLDLCGHDLVGPDGAAGVAGGPGEDGGAAIKIVPATISGDVTRLQIVDTVPDAALDIVGGNGGSGVPEGKGGAAVWVDERSTEAGVTVSVGASVGLSGGHDGLGTTALAVVGTLDRNDGDVALADIVYNPAAADVSYVWDGVGHGISVSVTTPKEGYEVLYSPTAEGPYDPAQPLYADVCDRAEIWYLIRAEGYAVVTNVGHVTIDVYGVGHAGTGKVTSPKTLKVGKKATWKATADEGSAFAGWSGACVDGLSDNERRNPKLVLTVTEGMSAPVASFVLPDADQLSDVRLRVDGPLVAGSPVVGMRLVDDSRSYLTAKVKGLPAGLKFNAKTLAVTGTPNAAGDYAVKIEASNASGYKLMVSQTLHVSAPGQSLSAADEPVVVPSVALPLVLVADPSEGKVTGSGVYAAGKIVTLTAKPAKGFVFAGWYRDPSHTETATFSSGDYRLTSQKFEMSAPSYFFARFVPTGGAVDEIKLSCQQEVSCRAGAPFDGAAMALSCLSASLPSYSAKGLPSGLKIDKNTGVISGTPTKLGRFDVSVSALNQSKHSATVRTTIAVGNYYSSEIAIQDSYGPFEPGVAVELSVPEARGCTAKGLPSGLKWKSATGLISGTPKKAGEYAVIFKKSVKVGGKSVACQSSATFVIGARQLLVQSVSCSARSEASSEQETVDLFEDAIVGRYTGLVRLADGRSGAVSLVVSSAGIVSGNCVFAGVEQTFSVLASLDDCVALVPLSLGGEAFVFRLERIARDVLGGSVVGETSVVSEEGPLLLVSRVSHSE